MDPYAQLAAQYRWLARRPVPAAWRCHPALADITGVDAVVDTVRAARTQPAASDATLRALLELGHDDQNALATALYALAPMLMRRVARSRRAYQIDVLSDLTMVVLEAAELDRLDNLAHRLVARAHTRAAKRTHREIERHEHGAQWRTLPHTYDDDLNAPVERTDPADIAVDRVVLQSLHAAVHRATERGELPVQVWNHYVAGRLQLVFTPGRLSSGPITAARRARLRLAPYIERELVA